MMDCRPALIADATGTRIRLRFVRRARSRTTVVLVQGLSPDAVASRLGA